MITELNKRLSPEWAGRSVQKKISTNTARLTSERKYE
jgi:hypothetical protein